LEDSLMKSILFATAAMLALGFGAASAEPSGPKGDFPSIDTDVKPAADKTAPTAPSLDEQNKGKPAVAPTEMAPAKPAAPTDATDAPPKGEKATPPVAPQ
jgi:hypothetical protein